MNKQLLNGVWQLQDAAGEYRCASEVPGCNFLDLERAGIIPNPLIGTNENDVQWVAKRDWIFTREFTVDESVRKHKVIELVCEMLDTLCTLELNGKVIGTSDNINRTWVWQIQDLLQDGVNTLRVTCKSPFDEIARLQKQDPLPNSTMGEAGSCQIRKTPYHFGWDWGPHLLPAGISRDIWLRGHDGTLLDDVRSTQKHEDGKVTLHVESQAAGEQADQAQYRYTLYDGATVVAKAQGAQADMRIDNPRIWWCNGLGAQPLYRLTVEMLVDGKVADSREMTIGLRTLELDNRPDAIGRNFCFVLNGEPIFARGANWIATDSFINRTTPEQLEDLIVKARRANFNMIRVWGGAYYESNLFYELCDKYGILVWQDCNFACSPYPFMREDFVKSLHLEIIDNVKRLRHHPCLCLWAGNNEIESMSMMWLTRRDVIRDTGVFFYETLRKWMQELDPVTPYWACTPSSGEYMKRINHDDYGDTHLWHVWHGLRPLEFYRKRLTRFCSEFGIESLPSQNALDVFAGEGELSLDMPVMRLHQKCMGGNSKMLYYVLSRYWEPAKFRDMVYMTQIAQMECVREATEHWRRNKGRCNGSLYWQYNDCWGVSSWSGMDYYGNPKAAQYHARHYFAPITVTVENTVREATVSVHNDTLADIQGNLITGIATFDGQSVMHGSVPMTVPRGKVVRTDTVRWQSYLTRKQCKNCYFYAHWTDADGNVLSSRTFPLLREKDSNLPKSKIDMRLQVQGGMATITLQSDTYARYTFVRIRGLHAPLSDNFFDLLPGKVYSVTCVLPEDWDEDKLRKQIEICSMADIAPKRSRLADKFVKTGIFLMPVNFVNYIARTFDK